MEHPKSRLFFVEYCPLVDELYLCTVQKKNKNQLFPPLVRAVVAALDDIFIKGFYADKVIERTLRADKRRGARDRAFIAQNVYEIVRYYRLLYTLLGKQPKIEADWWRLFGIHRLINGFELPAWREFIGLNPDKIQIRLEQSQGDRKIIESIPDWIDALGVEELGEKWDTTLHTLNRPAQLVLRINSLKASQQQVQQALLADDIATKQLANSALLVVKRQNLFRTEAFRKGWFEVQDWSSQQVAPCLDVDTGMRVVDACAGAGGKTLHLANLMQNKGQIIALDTETWKLDQLRKRARRNSVHIVETRPINSNKVIKRLQDSADRLLLDVPCSGLGVLRRNPDSKWKLSPEFIEKIKTVQQNILQRYSKMVKPGGKMVYATCSILSSENENQVEAFLATEAGASWTLEHQRTILPQDEGFDGFFMARLAKAD